MRVGGLLASTCHNVRYRTRKGRLCYLFVSLIHSCNFKGFSAISWSKHASNMLYRFNYKLSLHCPFN